MNAAEAAAVRTIAVEQQDWSKIFRLRPTQTRWFPVPRLMSN